MLISSVLSILGGRETASEVGKAASPAGAEPFAAMLDRGKTVLNRASDVPDFLQDGMAVRDRAQTLQPKERAAIFSVQKHSFDSFLRALEESKKPLGVHALDLFQ